MPTKTLLKLVFIALSAHSIAFAGSDSYNGQDLNEANLERKHPNRPSAEGLLPTDSLALVEAPAAQGTLEWPPREIIGQILGQLSKPDLLNVRLVNKNFGAIAIPLLTDVRIPGNIPSEAQAERFFQDFTTAFWRGKKPPEAFITLFRHAPLKELNLSEKKISAETLNTLLLAFPSILEELLLSYNNIGNKEAKVLIQHLPATFRRLYLNDNNIGPKGAKAVAEKLPSTLRVLYLSQNNIGDEGAKALAQQLPATLLWLGLDKNNIGDDGAIALAEKLPIGLLSLSLKHNNIGVKGLRALLAAIPRTDLEYLTISVPETSPLREQFKNLRNRQGQTITVTFE